MLRIEQGFPEKVFAPARDERDPLLMYARYIHHNPAHRRPGEVRPVTLIRIEEPTFQKIQDNSDWQEMKMDLPEESIDSKWDIERIEHPEWTEVAIWIAARSLAKPVGEMGSYLYERLTILSYPSTPERKIEAFVRGDEIAQDLLVATAVVGMLTASQRP